MGASGQEVVALSTAWPYSRCMIKNAMKANTTEKVTVKYEHRLIKEHTADWYGPVTYKVGFVVAKTNTPDKKKYYGDVVGHGATIDIPADKVGVFKITKVTKVAATEEAL